jgi:hypothetical protein
MYIICTRTFEKFSLVSLSKLCLLNIALESLQMKQTKMRLVSFTGLQCLGENVINDASCLF